jgi:hypothetical protein
MLCAIAVGLLFAGVVSAAADVYRWVVDEGVVHYSDQPFPGAEKVTLRSAPAPGTRLPANATPRSQRPADESPNAQATADAAGYESLAISSPAAEETVWNIGSVLNVTLSLQPALQPGHRVRVYFDGERRDVSGTQFQIEEVFRGVHNIQAEIVDASGQLKIRSEPNRFYVQQTSVINRPGN